MEEFVWLRPEPMWPSERSASATFFRPAILELTSDRFMEDFEAALAKPDPTQGVAGDRAVLREPAIDAELGRPRLYLPFHERYYLVAATLSCKRLGFPDREIRRGDEERVSLVLRRMDPDSSSEQEHGWVPGVGWVPVGDDELVTAGILRDFQEEHGLEGEGGEDGQEERVLEELLPLAAATAGSGRQVHYGYLPLSSREVYTPVEGPFLEVEGVAVNKFGSTVGGKYRVRCVYQRPLCPDLDLVVSQPTREFGVSNFLDVKAPHREVRIALDFPETVQELKRTVGFALSANLRKIVGGLEDKDPSDLVDGIDPSMADGDPAACKVSSFSIPVITLCALILLAIIAAILSPILAFLGLPLKLCMPPKS